MNHKQLILALAQLVVQHNLVNYISNCGECNSSPTSDNFSTYGATEETIESVLLDLY